MRHAIEDYPVPVGASVVLSDAGIRFYGKHSKFAMDRGTVIGYSKDLKQVRVQYPTLSAHKRLNAKHIQLA